MNQHATTRPASCWAIPLLALTLLGSGCDLVAPPETKKRTGTFLDSPVEGLRYASGKYTNADGHFRYKSGDNLTFKIGDIVLGQAKGQRLVTPVTLGEEVEVGFSNAASNIAQFLQSIDQDRNAENGIVIPLELHDAAAELTLDFDLPSAEFGPAAYDVLQQLVPGSTLIAQSAATSHLVGSLLESMAGHYRADCDGATTGEMEIIVNREGRIGGWVFLQGQSLLMTTTYSQGNITHGGVFGFIGRGWPNDGAFSGTLADGSIEGAWRYWGDEVDDETDGTIEGSLHEGVTPFLGDEVAQFVGSYSGAITGSDEEFGGFSINHLGDLDESYGNLELFGTIKSIDGDVAKIIGLTDEGDRISGTINADGLAKGTWKSQYWDESGTFEFTRN